MGIQGMHTVTTYFASATGRASDRYDIWLWNNLQLVAYVYLTESIESSIKKNAFIP